MFKAFYCFYLLVIPGLLIAAQMAPPPPPPPRFITMRGFPLSCFDKPNFEEDGLEFFVCNGGAGIVGARKKNDPTHTVFVRDEEIAHNLNMQKAKSACEKGRFGVRSDAQGTISFLCQGKAVGSDKSFQAASKADWKKYVAYLNR